MSGLWGDDNNLPSGLYTPQQKRIPWFWIILVVVLGGFFILISFLSVHYAYAARILKIGDLPPKSVAIVLGAAVNADGTPSDALMDRIKTGAMLYQYGLVRDVLLSGDDGKYHEDEVDAMKKASLELGVPEEHLFVDPQGYRTYESCKRAIQTYHISEAIIVTQRFHLPRALFLCNELGIDSIGVSADLQKYQKESAFEFREFFADVKAFIDIYLHEPAPPVKSK